MEINLKQAISMFFSQSSFDMVYLEAVANALDAGASKIHISTKYLFIDFRRKFTIFLTEVLTER